MERKDLRPSWWCRNFAESCFREETGNGVWNYMRPVWSLILIKTVTCIALSANRKWWLGAIFGVPANLGPCYISVVFPSFCHCFVSVREYLIIQEANNWSLIFPVIYMKWIFHQLNSIPRFIQLLSMEIWSNSQVRTWRYGLIPKLIYIKIWSNSQVGLIPTSKYNVQHRKPP